MNGPGRRRPAPPPAAYPRFSQERASERPKRATHYHGGSARTPPASLRMVGVQAAAPDRALADHRRSPEEVHQQEAGGEAADVRPDRYPAGFGPQPGVVRVQDLQADP